MVHLHNGILCSRDKEGAPTLCNSLDGTGDYYANEINQVVKDKYHMISPLTGTQSTTCKSKQNITKEIQSKLIFENWQLRRI